MKLASYFRGKYKKPQRKHGVCLYMLVIKIWFSALLVHVYQMNLVKPCNHVTVKFRNQGDANCASSVESMQMKTGHEFRLAES